MINEYIVPMMFESSTMELPFMADVPKRVTSSKSKMEIAICAVREMKQLVEKHGMLIPSIIASEVLGVSKTRVYELLKTGQLTPVRYGNYTYVTEDSLITFAKTERKAGRPPKMPETLNDTVAAAIRIGKDRQR